MTTWYWKDTDNNQFGPVTPDKLLNLIRSGDVLRETMVRKDSSSWCRSDQINGLWDAAAKPHKIYLCVECGGQIERPPSRCSRCERLVEKANEKMVTPDMSRLKHNAASAKPAEGMNAIQSVVQKATSLRDRFLPKSRDK
jgi:GYF domain 2